MQMKTREEYKKYFIDRAMKIEPGYRISPTLDIFIEKLVDACMTDQTWFDSFYIKQIDLNIISEKDTACIGHKWKTYNGFTEKYDYCELCDAKK